jgi:hypothetical protein
MFMQDRFAAWLPAPGYVVTSVTPRNLAKRPMSWKSMLFFLGMVE